MEVCVFYKWDGVMYECAVLDIERGQLPAINPRPWQNDTAIAKNSWGYTEGNHFKTPYELICNLIDVVSKNGCLMLTSAQRRMAQSAMKKPMPCGKSENG